MMCELNMQHRPLPRHLAAADRHRQAPCPCPTRTEDRSPVSPRPPTSPGGRGENARRPDRLSSRDTVHAPVVKTWRLRPQGLGLSSSILMVPRGKPVGGGCRWAGPGGGLQRQCSRSASALPVGVGRAGSLWV